jgi:hypothetical protein
LEGRAGVRADVVNGEDVGMIQLSGRPRLRCNRRLVLPIVLAW